jgi:uncharacterized coiled-coil DUF342 family protein
MGVRIPQLLKIKVLNQWLKGVSRDSIAINYQISGGSVSAIIQDFKNKDIPDIDLLRGVAVELRNKDLELNQFASSMRLRKMLDNLDLPEERIEKFLEHLCVFFYKDDDRNVEKFLSQLESVSEMAISLDTSIYDILGELDKKRIESRELDNEIYFLKQQIDQKRSEFNKMVKDIENYRAARKSEDYPLK